jgi:hypothetical protein
MNLKKSLQFMMFGSFFIQMFVMSLIMSNTYQNITYSQGKFYLSVIMAVLMGFLEVFMFDTHMNIISWYYYIILTFLLIIFIYLYRNQIYIQEKEYLKEMIEHHSMAILTSEEILQKNIPEKIKRLAENILTTQEKEIEYMKQLL